MKIEFERFKLKKLGIYVIFLQILGALGLLVGLLFTPIMLSSSGGLSLLMFLGLVTRIKSKDNLLATLHAIFFMFLNYFFNFIEFRFKDNYGIRNRRADGGKVIIHMAVESEAGPPAEAKPSFNCFPI